MSLIGLSHVVEDGMITYPGLPGPQIDNHLTFEQSRGHYAEGTEFTIGRINMVGNTGTYLDTPAHRYREGYDLSGLPLDHCADLPAIVVDGANAIGADTFSGIAVRGAAVLLRTGWDQYWGTSRYGDPSHPHLTEDGAYLLAERGALLVGIDSVNIDATNTGQRPAHTVLLAAQIPVVEHLTRLGTLPRAGARFFAVPPAVRGLATFPVRAFALMP